MMEGKPLVSVIMPVFNTEEYLEDAIKSILNQTFSNFEFIIIDDASTDKSLQIIESFTDSRIVVITKNKNTGYTKSLNLGLNLAQGKYIARMDSDDISLPKRFQLQIDLMEKNPEIILCGTSFKLMNSSKVINHPNGHSEIVLKLLEGTAFGHPTVMIRNEILKNNNIVYNHEYEPAEDYFMWTQLVKFGYVENIPEVLLLYRVHSNQVSSLHAERQQKIANRIRGLYFVQFFNELTKRKLLKEFDFDRTTYKELALELVIIEKLLLNEKVIERKLESHVLEQIVRIQSFIFSSRKYQRIQILLWLFFHTPSIFRYNSLRLRFSYVLRSIFKIS
jgi:glycosyltransferase involved in cell wall biosynthesis